MTPDPSLAFVVVLMTGIAVLLMAQAWPVQLGALLAQYLAVCAFSLTEALPVLAGLRLLGGGMVCLILLLTLRGHPSPQVVWYWRTPHPPSWERFFRIAIVALTLVIAAGLAAAHPFPGATATKSFAAYSLASAGTLFLIVSHRVLNLGFGLLLLDSAVQLLGTTAIKGIGVIELSLVSVVSIVLALAIAFLVALERELAQEGQ